jgi:hypothetical protein
MSEKADFEPSLKRASHFVKIIVACPHRLPKLPELMLRKQARPNNGSLFYSHCALDLVAAGVMPSFGTFFAGKPLFGTFITVIASLGSLALR